LPYLAHGRAIEASRRPAPPSTPSWQDPGIGDAEYGVIVLGRNGGLRHASDTAGRWLREYFDARPRKPVSLPQPLWKWLRGHRRSGADDRGQPQVPTFSVTREGRRLVVRLIPDRARRFLVLEERPPAPGPEMLKSFRLTARESEVLAWVAVGKANQDIAAILNISPRTVKKHLEHIYDKLGVETRTAAATFFALLSSARTAGQARVVAERSASGKRRIDDSARPGYVRDAEMPRVPNSTSASERP
jgi:DNA-binding CsgD family transcriptional regulator